MEVKLLLSAKTREQNYYKRLKKLIESSEKGKMIGDWNDCGRLQ